MFIEDGLIQWQNWQVIFVLAGTIIIFLVSVFAAGWISDPEDDTFASALWFGIVVSACSGFVLALLAWMLTVTPLVVVIILLLVGLSYGVYRIGRLL